jgi:predicted nucleic acid-binding protein
MANSFYIEALLDSSALAKRYIPEKGSARVDAIFDTVPSTRKYFLNVGAGEVLSVLVRKRNAGTLSDPDFAQAVANFHSEIAGAAIATKTPVTSRLVAASLPLIVAHSVNSTDALTLKSAPAIARKLRAEDDDLVLVASDQRLLRASQAEGLRTFNPESQDYAALAPLIAP